MAGKKDVNPSRLAQAVQDSRKATEWFRERRRHNVGLYAGGYYSAESSKEGPRPINLLDLYVRVMSRHLIPKEPRVMVSTFAGKHKPAARTLQDWFNRRAVKVRLADVLLRAVVDAFFQIGVVKVAPATPADAAAYGWGLEAGEPYAMCVDLDDFVYDTMARDWGQFAYVGHAYRVPLDAVKDSKIYSSARKKLQPSERREFNSAGDQRTDALSDWASVGSREPYLDLVDLWEIYLPQSRQVVTMADDGAGCPDGSSEPLRVTDWTGPAHGPYRRLGFGWPPGSPMPKGVMNDLVALDDDANKAWNKLSEQAQRLKRVGLVMSSNVEDAQTIMALDDGTVGTVSNPNSFTEAQFGGPSPELLAFFQATRDVFNFMAGNLNATGGLAPNAKTLGQDKMLTESAGLGVADMQGEVLKFVGEVMGDLLWWYWHNPRKVMRSPVSAPGVPEVSVTRRLFPRLAAHPETRRPLPASMRRAADWDELELAIDPYSLQHATPQSRSATLKGLLTQLVLPVMGLLQQQGVMLDMGTLLAKVGEYDDIPDLQEILTVAEPPVEKAAARGGAGQEGAGMAPQTSREYVRRNVPQDTEDTRQQEVMETLRAARENSALVNGRPR